MRLGQKTSISESDSCVNWDIFCAVVDNYGDIGVCWRLARQLAAEHGFRVRLWVDDLAAFQKIYPEIDPRQSEQMVRGVEIRRWTSPFPTTDPAEVVVESFACSLPDRYIAAMAGSERKPVWINLEHLSAEDWVGGCHGLPSPHPRLPLTKYFFFPGFTPDTGGLLAESGLAERRRKFQQNPLEINEFWQLLGLPASGADVLKVSLFCYQSACVSELLAAMAGTEFPVLCLVPDGVAETEISAFFSRQEARRGNFFRRASLIVQTLPFFEQDEYDKFLWACDVNFVRGEDSFVRAQWAAKPMVWQAYPQEGGAHRSKLQSFLDRYGADLAPDVAAAYVALSKAWNQGAGVGEAWPGFLKHRTALELHARSWAEGLLEIGDLATNLVNFCKNKLK